VVVDPQESCDAWTLGEAIAQPIVAAVDSGSPLTQHVRLDNVLFPGARLLNFTAEAEPLVRDPLEQPLLARLRRTGGDAVVLTCNLEQGDLPLRIAFPVLMKNTIEWFQGNSGELRPAVATGRVMTIDVPVPQNELAARDDASAKAPAAAAEPDVVVVESAAQARHPMELVSPSSAALPLAATSDQVTIGPLLETGLWTVRPAAHSGATAKNSKGSADRGAQPTGKTEADDPQVIQVACNLVDAAESDLRPRAELADVEGRALLAIGGQSMWFYLTLVAAALIAGEWWLYQRRIVG
jgi:hypothetical protein